MSNQNPGCLGFLVSLLKEKAKPLEQDLFPYRLTDSFLSPAELSFCHVLRTAVGTQYTINCKVSLADLFYVPDKEIRLAYTNKIDRKHVDFLLCDLSTMKPIAGIELDDSSHTRASARRRPTGAAIQ